MQKKKQRIILFALLGILLVSTPFVVYAWFSLTRQIATVTPVSAPTVLVLGSGNQEDIAYFSLGDIDVESTTRKSYVFSVYSEDVNMDYMIGIAHTTNIDFTYRIYKASIDDGGSLVYVTREGVSQYYQKGEEMPITWLNSENKYQALSTDSYYNNTYGDTEQVQSDAIPLYGKTDKVIRSNQATKGFCDYYILDVTWENLKNDKETDIIYLSVVSDS